MMKANKILSLLGTDFLTVSETEFIYGPSGRFLLRNVEDVWWKYCVVSEKYNVYPTQISQVSRTLRYLRDSRCDGLPFGLASIETTENDQRQSKMLDLPLPPLCTRMSVMTFGEKTSAKDLFYRKQRERKAWWRKFSNNPSRFVTTNSEKNENREVMSIQAHLPSQDLSVEVVSFGKVECYLQNCQSGSISEAYIVEHTTSLELAVLTLLCDGYAEDKKSLHLHPKLAPYKALIMPDNTGNEELLQLVVYLNNQLKAESLNTIVSSTSNDVHVLQVPYVILVDNDSLRTGIVQVTNQLTTISERVHITDLVKNIAACCT
ncbi:DNA polymerase subunit gamma-2, mitochondrial [Neodiprion virginianus]|uniref:DNA polymerase subunit gamma-2, mitochondrial n=1 Tax=Neodiprion virginianus TaxID=2961670 RepID=UPI001EE6D133|nr:DNA polymerase subunit gamma-2, mitochondrial [Neodiprion virginianus]